jgi:hypothetical protein
MKLTNDREFVEQSIDIIDLIEDLKTKYRTVYWIHLDGQIYVYKPLGRKDHKDLVENENITTMDKEDQVIYKTLLHPNPKEFDLDDLPAGIVNKLFTTIMENSFLDSVENRTAVMNFYRSEMYDLSNQIPCLINEAFPQFDIEEIENWDVERTSKYLSRAEWKLQNLRGLSMNYELIQQQEESSNQVPEEENKGMDNVSKAPEEPSKQATSNKKEPLTAERLAELKRKFPEINWENDTVLTEGEAGMADAVDVVSPALRVPK